MDAARYWEREREAAVLALAGLGPMSGYGSDRVRAVLDEAVASLTERVERAEHWLDRLGARQG